MNIILYDKGLHENFLPLTYTRSIADYRIGILTIREKWEKLIGVKPVIITEDYLQYKYETTIPENAIIVLANIIPNKDLINNLQNLNQGKLVQQEQIIAYTYTNDNIDTIPVKSVEYEGELSYISNNQDIFTLNGICITKDFELLTKGRTSAEISKTNVVLGDNPVFVESGCFIECSTINTQDGPVYIGKDSKIMEGSHIRGPFAICENSEIKMGAKIYGATTVGPWCKVGGEINNTVFFGYSNKAHDGFLGNSVIGEWCNIGADSNNSNLKNNYATVKLWNYADERFIDTGLQFCGLIMADHSKCGINTMFNTGTVIGVSSNIFGSGFPRNFVPSFSWGGNVRQTYKINTAFDVMEKVMSRRNKILEDKEKQMFKEIFARSMKFRNF